MHQGAYTETTDMWLQTSSYSYMVGWTGHAQFAHIMVGFCPVLRKCLQHKHLAKSYEIIVFFREITEITLALIDHQVYIDYMIKNGYENTNTGGHKMANIIKTERDIVRTILNREHTYSIARYVQAIKKAGYGWTRSDVHTCLNHMRNEKQITYHLVDGVYVCGCLIRKAAERIAA